MTPIVRLKSLRFERQDDDGTRVLFPVRRNSKQSGGPRQHDWVRTAASIQSQAVAFICDKVTRLPTVTIVLDVLAGSDADVYIRAVARGGTRLGQIEAVNGGPLVAQTPRTMSLTLAPTVFPFTTVDRHFVTWLWQWSPDRERWTDFDESTHTVFFVLKPPAVPWDVGPGPAPWDGVLELACKWARGESREDPCITALTRGVHGLGGQIIVHTKKWKEEITWADGGSFVGTKEQFFLTNFVSTANLEPRSAASLSCRDTASAVAVLASALGADVRIKALSNGHDKLRTNGIQLLGLPATTRKAFAIHEVTLNAAGSGTTERVWDACLKVDTDSKPSQQPPAGHGLPTGMPLRVGTGPNYLERLLVAVSQGLAIRPVAQSGFRYPDRNPPEFLPPIDVTRQERREAYATLMPATLFEAAAHFPGGAELLKTTLEPFVLVANSMPLTSGGQEYELHRLTIIPPLPGRPVVRVAFVVTDDAFATSDLFLYLATNFTSELRSFADVGRFALWNDEIAAVLFLLGNVVVQVVADDAAIAVATAQLLERIIELGG